ncbi:MAG: TVP38/TMEM64 family protein [Acidobacteria bacterium]|nr:MAG: TVP38/TMEM64 family protein [Acidobacteriota bacterium]REK09148.1 MAG: TVP38/TMEM64 family protein [Acidobacteriota bacterium]
MKNGRRLILALAVALLAAAIWWLAREHLTLERVVASEQALRVEIERHAVRSWLLGFSLYTLVSLVPGTSGKSIVFGWLFGLWAGTAMVTLALTLAATIAFLVCRYLLRDWLQRRLGRHLRRVDRRIERDGAFYMLTLRMLHAPYSLVNASAAASSIGVRTFAWTTWVGLLPGTLIFVGLGSSLPTLEELLEQGARGVVRPELFLLLLASGALPWCVRFVFRRLTGHSPRGPLEEGAENHTA